jgi:4-oxalomesaconate tautomerase
MRIEHPSGFLEVDTSVDPGSDGVPPAARRTAVVRTARKIFDGTVFPRPAETAPMPAIPLEAHDDSPAR